LITRAGEPTATLKSGIFLVTTEFAPITQFFPIFAPITHTFSPNQDPE